MGFDVRLTGVNLCPQLFLALGSLTRGPCKIGEVEPIE